MKKLLTLAVAVLAAVCVQAATTSWDWAFQNLYAMDDAEGGSGYDGFVTGSVTLINADATGDMTSTFSDDGTASGTVTGDTTGAFAAEAPWQAKISVNIGGTDYEKVINFTMPAGLTGDIQNDSGKFADLNQSLTDAVMPDGILLTSTMADAGWTVVPEPTSVALIALGLAAFGLKRKVA